MLTSIIILSSLLLLLFLLYNYVIGNKLVFESKVFYDLVRTLQGSLLKEDDSLSEKLRN